MPSVRRVLLVLAIIVLTGSFPRAQDGAGIADDPELFSERFRAEFRDMNATFAEFGFEIDVFEEPRPSLATIAMKYGEPDRSDEVAVVLGTGAEERRVTLTFYYYEDVGFGVLPDDPDQRVLRVKRRED